MRILIISVAMLCLLLPNQSLADELTLEKKEAIKELLQITGMVQLTEMLGNLMIQEMTKVLKIARPDIDPKAFNILKEEMDLLLYDELVIKDSFFPYMYPIYHKHLKLKDIKDLIQFYKTPLGQKLITVMPKMTQEGTIAGQKWGRTIGPQYNQKVSDRLKKEGIKMDM